MPTAKKGEKRRRGAPSSYSEQRARDVCNLIATGHSLRQIAAIPGMPSRETILDWLRVHEDFVPQYTRARELQAEHFADELLEISDDGSNDWIERARQDGSVETVLNQEHVQRSRLRADTRKWLMARMAPKKYGDKLGLEHAGKDGAALTVEIVRFSKPGTPS